MPPVVDINDVVKETEGMTPTQIAEYFANREQTILENARNMINDARTQNTPPTTPPTPPTPPEPKFVTQEELRNITGAAHAGLVSMAQMTARQGKEFWDRLFPEVKKIVEALTPESQVNSAIWEEAYYNVQGRMTGTLITEARNRALGLEPPSPTPPTPPKERVFTDDEMTVINGIGTSPAKYADAEKKLAEGFQPFTTDSRKPRTV